MIVTDEKILRQPCVDVLPHEVDELRNRLELELKQSEENGLPGIGLAAPQIGIHKNMAIIRIDNKFKVDLINCKISEQYDLFQFDGEGCLSFPGQFEFTMRYNEILVTNNLVQPFSFVARGLFAVAIQHEIDHLHGKLLPDFVIKKKSKSRPNDPCPCGSKDSFGNVKKYKKCHGA